MMRRVLTLGPVGHLRPAPGTWASALAVLAGMAIDRYLGTAVLVGATAAVTYLGFRLCAWVLRPGEDPAEVVLDEVAGQWLALLFVAVPFWARGHEGWLPWPAWVAPFLLFRLFDIWKPWLVGRADRRGDAAGVMLDDLFAGLFAGLSAVAAAALYHGVAL
jgi:phosphatidylglycerophosphatase A